MTTAETISGLLGDNGSIFETEDGRTVADLTEEFGGDVECARLSHDGEPIRHPRSDVTSDSVVRYVFPDGSAIVESGGAWDIEGPEPFSWAGS